MFLCQCSGNLSTFVEEDSDEDYYNISQAIQKRHTNITKTHEIMNEENPTFDPRDLNQDGKVTMAEKIQYAATKAAEAIKETATEVAGKVKAYTDATPEERQAKNEELKAKANEVISKVTEGAKEVYGEIKENVAAIGKKPEAPVEAPQPEEAPEAPKPEE